jgi:hypothetical protein
VTPGTGDWQPTRGHVPAPCEARRYWSLNLSIRISNELARRHGMRVVWRRRGAAQALKHRKQVFVSAAPFGAVKAVLRTRPSSGERDRVTGTHF